MRFGGNVRSCRMTAMDQVFGVVEKGLLLKIQAAMLCLLLCGVNVWLAETSTPGDT
jgi:hypothetical protein